jgi:hypothetical protein
VSSRDIKTTAIFRAGGTLNLDVPSYVRRPADDELFRQVKAGQFCYVLTPRQMGKSSLMIRTAEQLRQTGVRTAILDLSQVGTQATDAQWYLGIVKQLAQALGLAVALDEWWRERAGLSPVQRFDYFLHDVVLAEVAEPIVIFVDEIDSTLKLNFTDDFFAAIRRTYNLRATDPAYDRLTFVLLGVAAPGDLIKDRNRTPFNIGRAIDLQEFSRADVRPIEEGLEQRYPGQGGQVLDRIFHWTGGHPYLTQKLCREISESGVDAWPDGEIDRLVTSLFLTPDAQKEDNLQFVRTNVETSPQRRQLARLYRQVYRGQPVKEDDRSPIQNRLKLTGLVRGIGGRLHVRNAIYRHVFNSDWIKRNIPVNWAQIVTYAAGAIIVVTIAAALLSYQAQRQQGIELLKEQYRQAAEVDAQMYQLYRLCTTAQREAQRVFFTETDPQRQQLLFDQMNSEAAGERLVVLFDCLYPSITEWIPDQQAREKLSSAMCCALYRQEQTYQALPERNCVCAARP